MSAYYNEFDPKAAAWLRELIKQGHIAPGEVDERSIEDVHPQDLKGFTQCHFFAGIGIWSHALRGGEWVDDRPVWTGSCPCQPFSAAGKGAGFDDVRHLWPAFYHLIVHAKPRNVPVFGEQVASPDGIIWLDVVQSDMEAAEHAFAAVDLCSAGFGASDIRQRLYFMAYAPSSGSRAGLRVKGQAGIGRIEPTNGGGFDLLGEPIIGRMAHADRERGRSRKSGSENAAHAGEPSQTCELADTKSNGRGKGRTKSEGKQGRSDAAERQSPSGLANSDGGDAGAEGIQRSGKYGFGQKDCGSSEWMDDACSDGRRARRDDNAKYDGEQPDAARASGQLADAASHRRDGQGSRGAIEKGRQQRPEYDGQLQNGSEGYGAFVHPRPLNGFWSDADWLFCRDGKWRPVEPGTFPLVNGAPFRLVRLRGYGNGLNAEVAKAWIVVCREFLS